MVLDGPAITNNLSISTTIVEARINATPLEDRKVIIIQPIDGDIYWSYSNTVTTSSGHLISSGTLIYISSTNLLPVYLVAATAVDVRISEAA